MIDNDTPSSYPFMIDQNGVAMSAKTILNHAIERCGLDRVSLKRRLEVSGHTVSRQRIHSWLVGTSVPSPDILPVLCEVLDLSAGDAAQLYTGSKIPLPAVLLPSTFAVPLSRAA
jgi:hypothetical protein